MERQAIHTTIVKIANIQIDVVLRASMLERLAGLTPGAWTRNIRRFFTEAPAMWPDADPRWFSNKGTAMYSALVSGANHILKDKTRAEDVVGEIYSRDMIKGLAKALEISDALSTGHTGWSKGQGLLFNRGKQWALDIVRSTQHKVDDRAMEVGVSDEDTIRYEPATEFNVNVSPRDQVVTMLGLMNTDPSVRDTVLSSLRRSLSESDMKVLEALLANPQESQKDLGARLFPQSQWGFSLVNKALGRAFDSVAEVAQTNPRIQDAIELAVQQRGHGAVHLASAAIGTVLFDVFTKLGLL